ENTVGDGSKLDKGPAKLPRDVPASIALARLSNVVNPIVQAYDKLASAAAIIVLGIGTSKKNQSAAAAVQTGEVKESFGEKLDLTQQVKDANNSQVGKGTIDRISGVQQKITGEQ
ncbi:hypothetical protein A4A49_61004, partial [Nicotiana attenuata]